MSLLLSIENLQNDCTEHVLFQFCIHEEIPTTMKWSSVARMLGMKFAVISKHNLTKGNIKHLKRQLFGIYLLNIHLYLFEIILPF